MRDELLAYLLDDADPEQRRRIEEHLRTDPIWQHEYEKLKACLEANADPPEKITTPPQDLVQKTCMFVRLAEKAGRCSAAPASLSESQDGCTGRKRWTLVDMTVAAAIFVAVGALLFPAILESRRSARRIQCQSNLQQVGGALIKSIEVGNRNLPHIDFHERAGMFVVELAERGTIDRQELAQFLVCPGSELADKVFEGRTVLRIPSPEELGELSREALTELHGHLTGIYAYQFGYLDSNGTYLPMPFVGRSDATMLGDSPNLSATGAESSNHGRCGQNILSQDGSVKFLSTCKSNSCIGHPFLNDQGEHAAGRGQRDNVLGRSDATPAGTFVRISQ